jgi:hypothetical protein
MALVPSKVHLAACPSVCPSSRPSVCPSVRPSVCLSVRPSVRRLSPIFFFFEIRCHFNLVVISFLTVFSAVRFFSFFFVVSFHVHVILTGFFFFANLFCPRTEERFLKRLSAGQPHHNIVRCSNFRADEIALFKHSADNSGAM